MRSSILTRQVLTEKSPFMVQIVARLDLTEGWWYSGEIGERFMVMPYKTQNKDLMVFYAVTEGNAVGYRILKTHTIKV